MQKRMVRLLVTSRSALRSIAPLRMPPVHRAPGPLVGMPSAQPCERRCTGLFFTTQELHRFLPRLYCLLFTALRALTLPPIWNRPRPLSAVGVLGPRRFSSRRRSVYRDISFLIPTSNVICVFWVVSARGCRWCVSFGFRNLWLAKNPILGASQICFFVFISSRCSSFWGGSFCQRRLPWCSS